MIDIKKFIPLKKPRFEMNYPPEVVDFLSSEDYESIFSAFDSGVHPHFATATFYWMIYYERFDLADHMITAYKYPLHLHKKTMFDALDSAADGYWSAGFADYFGGCRYLLDKNIQVNTFLYEYSGEYMGWSNEPCTILDLALKTQVPSRASTEIINSLQAYGAKRYCDLKNKERLLGLGIIGNAAAFNLDGTRLCLENNPLEPIELGYAVGLLYKDNVSLEKGDAYGLMNEIMLNHPNLYYSDVVGTMCSALMKDSSHFENDRQITFLEKLVTHQADLNEVYKWDNQGEPLLNRHGEKVSKTLLDVAYEQKAKTLIAFLRSHGAQTYAELDAAGLVPIDWEEEEYERVNREYEESLLEQNQNKHSE